MTPHMNDSLPACTRPASPPTPTVSRTDCTTILDGLMYVPPTPTNTALPPSVTGLGNSYGVPSKPLCAGIYSFSFSVYGGPDSRFTVGVFSSTDRSRRWFEDSVVLMLPVGISGACGHLNVPEHNSANSWAVGAWQETGDKDLNIQYSMALQTNDSLPACTTPPTPTVSSTYCTSVLEEQMYIPPMPTSTALPPTTMEFGNAFIWPGNPLCAGTYSFSFFVFWYQQGPDSRVTVGVFSSVDDTTKWWQDSVMLMLPVGNSGECGHLNFPEQRSAFSWAVGAWQETGYSNIGIQYRLALQTNDSLPACTRPVSSVSSTDLTSVSSPTPSMSSTDLNVSGLGDSKLAAVSWFDQPVSISKSALVGGVVGIAVAGAAIALLAVALVQFVKTRHRRKVNVVNLEMPPVEPTPIEYDTGPKDNVGGDVAAEPLSAAPSPAEQQKNELTEEKLENGEEMGTRAPEVTEAEAPANTVENLDSSHIAEEP
ncbi:uncharacterized protein SPPG_06550 [Spizellomyces punctatus DAOM BR117]|uniref:Uncharacterized protein n=1 Tax=Spizellomyces punctatus (strain DAOM BR117) TaxID=645134 RepID=A0A0L0HB35_SPIPD|nr:uncharacterized protein SPPG_06550 [Spizellomyces punctatus DAOM BR117]KNC98146.1 hypothetical protein SPPG_06550 [Spizellomyces punctatus DAOM BR117]|eukprot:XP_016606186.1 hypothetical protein SPPG_06550 [Spizellomyces punctatus DAOM BR117]